MTSDVIVGTEFADDGAVVRVPGGQPLVMTADVIAPIVDDPETFGAIAAANSISDIYAMGGTPLYALNLAFFPDSELPLEVLSAILAGGARVCRAAGVHIVGGHTVRDPEVKYGLSVVGHVREDQLLTNRGAREGQMLVLTKALGTGVLGTAIKKGVASSEQYAAAVASMTQLNGTALEIARRHRVSAATDVTGFGLLGHLRNFLRESALGARVYSAAVPLLPGALHHAQNGLIPGGSKSNLEFLEPRLTRTGSEDPEISLLVADAQTSGGLLLATAPETATQMVEELRAGDVQARRSLVN